MEQSAGHNLVKGTLAEQVGYRTVQEDQEGERRSLVVHTAVEVALRIDLVEGRRIAAGVEDIVGLVGVLHTGREAERRTAAGVEERRMQAVDRTAAAVVGRHTEVAVEERRNLAGEGTVVGSLGVLDSLVAVVGRVNLKEDTDLEEVGRILDLGEDSPAAAVDSHLAAGYSSSF